MSGNKKIIHFLSASDRINYGDLLFPIIFKKVLEIYKIEAEFYNYGIVKSDLSHFGALPTKSYRSFTRNVKRYGGNIVIGGGEVLFVDWNSLLAYISYRFSRLLKRKPYNRIFYRIPLVQFLFSRGRIFIPFAPNKNRIRKNNVKTFYNAVGGSFENTKIKNQDLKIKKDLQSADYISVRDRRALKSLFDNNISSVLSPDSALILSDLYSKDKLNKKSSIQYIDGNYLFFQVGIFHLPSDLNLLNKHLMEISEKLKLKIVLCPIGKANRHEDHVALNKLKKLNSDFELVYPESIFDIMNLIANSSVYLGSSLHGLITAQSFSIPFFGIHSRQIKMKSYCETWASINNLIEINEINNLIEILKRWDKASFERKLKEQKIKVYSNFESIFDVMESYE